MTKTTRPTEADYGDYALTLPAGSEVRIIGNEGGRVLAILDADGDEALIDADAVDTGAAR